LRPFGAALQEFERKMRPSRCPGPEMKREYVEMLFHRVTHQNGAIFLAEADGSPVGYLACHIDEDVLEQIRAELVVSTYGSRLKCGAEASSGR